MDEKELKTRTENRIEMAEMVLATLGSSYDPALLAEICANDYITDGECVTELYGEKGYYENGEFVIRREGVVIGRRKRSLFSEDYQEQAFCIWAAKKATTPRG